MSPTAQLDSDGNPVADHTVDASTVTEGTLVYLHGYEPAVVFGTEPDGKVEVGRFAEFVFTEAANLSTHRGPRPDWAGPEPEAPADRIAALEKQLAALTALLSQPKIAAAIQAELAPTAAAPAEAAPAAAAPAAPPVNLFGAAPAAAPVADPAAGEHV